MSVPRFTSLAAATALLTVCLAHGQQPVVPIPRAVSPLSDQERAAYKVGRRDLGRVYLALERAVIEHPDQVRPRVREINQRVDAATGYFFSGDFATASRLLVEQTQRIVHDQPDRHLQAAAGIRARLTPGVLTTGAPETTNFTIELARLFPSPAASIPPELTMRLVSDEGHVHLEKEVQAPLGPTFERVLHEAFTPPMTGRIHVEIGRDRVFERIGSITVTERPLAKIRDELLRRLATVPSDGNLARAAWITRWRIEQLTDENAAGTSGLVIDFVALSSELSAEVDALANGSDPYQHATGDLWMPANVGGAPLPMRVIVPDLKPRHNGPMVEKFPVLIAVHGAGGDEHLFASVYGGGRLKELATERGFILVSPQAGVLAGMPATFDAILESVKYMKNADTSQVYLMGHSLGGGIVTSWAKARPEAVSGVVSIAGIGLFNGAKKLPRTLAIAGELDGLCRPERIERDSNAAKAAGLPVEYRLIKDYGHALVVGACMDQALDWLFERAED